MGGLLFITARTVGTVEPVGNWNAAPQARGSTGGLPALTSAATAAATTAPATAAAAATAATAPVLGFFHGDLATLHVTAVELFNGLARLLLIRHLDEAETARTPSLTIGDDLGVG